MAARNTKSRSTTVAVLALWACGLACTRRTTPDPVRPPDAERDPPRVELPPVDASGLLIARKPPLARRISSGGQHACYATAEGRVQCWGENRNGELGRGTESWGEPRPAWVPGLEGVTEIAAGNSAAAYGSTCAVHRSGRVSCWGVLTHTSSPRAVPDIVDARSVTVDGTDACALVGQGEVVCWGANTHGRSAPDGAQAGTPRRVSGIGPASAVRMNGTQTCALLESGDVSCWGRIANEITKPQKVAGLTGVIEIALGYGLLARRRDGSVLLLGLGAPRAGKDRLQIVSELDLGGQVALHGAWPCQLDKLGRVGCRTREGKPLSTLERLPDPGLGPAIQLDSSNALSCVLHAQGAEERVSCWGSNEHGQIGLGDAIGVHAMPVASAGEKSAASLRLAHSGACALDGAGNVSCWGGDEAKRVPVEGAPKVERLLEALDYAGMCGQPKDGDEVCWSLGTPRRAVAMPGLRGVTDQARYAGNGGEWVYAIIKESLHAWRLNQDTRKPEVRAITAAGALVRVIANSMAVCVQDKTGKVTCATPADPFGADAKHAWLPVETSTKLREITAGAHVCGLEESGAVSCYKGDALPAAGTIRLIPQRAFSPSVRLARGYNLCAQGVDDVIRCSVGLDARGSGVGDQTNVGSDFGAWKDVAGLAAGSSLTCLWTKSGDVRCAGSNDYRQLGIEDPVRVAEPRKVELAQ